MKADLIGEIEAKKGDAPRQASLAKVADAFVTANAELRDSVQGLVPTAPIDDLHH